MTRFSLASVLTASFLVPAAFSQFRENTTPELTCDQRGSSRDYSRWCEMREVRLPVTQRLDIQAAPNGGVTVKGWNRPEILVRARVDAASKEGEAAAKALVSKVQLNTSAGRVTADGPSQRETRDESWWSASYEIFAPHKLDVSAKSVNGGITFRDIEGALTFDTINGGVSLSRVAGDVRGKAVNGGLKIELDGERWRGVGMDVSTTNGGVTLALPASYSADLRASTVHGGVSADFPVPVRKQNSWGRQDLEMVLGNGGPTVSVRTVNGGVKIRRGVV